MLYMLGMSIFGFSRWPDQRPGQSSPFGRVRTGVVRQVKTDGSSDIVDRSDTCHVCCHSNFLTQFQPIEAETFAIFILFLRDFFDF